MNFDQVAAGASPEVPTNENFEAVKVAGAYGQRASTTSALTWGYYGVDTYNGNAVASGTVALTDNATNYVVALRSTGAVSVSTSSTNSTDPLYARVRKLTTASGLVTVNVDERLEANGLLLPSVAGGGGLLAANNLSDVANAATSRTNLGVDTAIAAAITALIGGAPGALDTLNELAAAINDDASYAAAVTTALGLKAPLDSPALTGSPTAPTQAPGDSSTKLATTEYVDDAVAAGGGGGGGGASLSTANTWTATQSTANVDLTDASNITPNGAAGNSFYLLTTSAVGSTRNIALPSGTLVPGTAYNFEVKQPASGGPCAVVFAAGYKWGLGGAGAQPTGATTASASDLYGGIVQEDGNIHMSMVGQAGPTGTAGTNGTNGAGAYTAGRLTLTTGVPVTTSDVTGATTIYFTPYKGDQIQLWDGASWTAYTFAETSLALGTLTSDKNYDVFAYQSGGTLTLEMLVWTNDTTRATAVTLQDGRYCKSGDKTRLYLGTFRTTSTTTTEDSGGGTSSQVGGKRYLWNYYNRVERHLQVIDSTDNWSYTTNTIRQANAATGNKVEMVVGVSEDAVQVAVNSTVYIGNSTQGAKAGAGINSTTVVSGLVAGGFQGATTFMYSPFCSNWRGFLPAGYNYIAWVEEGAGSGTCLFLGDNGDEIQSGLYAVVQA